MDFDDMYWLKFMIPVPPTMLYFAQLQLKQNDEFLPKYISRKE